VGRAYGSVGLAEANATAAFSVITAAALDSDRGRSDRAGFATTALTAEPVGTAARSIKRKIFSLSPTIFFNPGAYRRLWLRGFARVRAESQFASNSRRDAGCHRQGDNL
jgi:hypothetical protein